MILWTLAEIPAAGEREGEVGDGRPVGLVFRERWLSSGIRHGPAFYKRSYLEGHSCWCVFLMLYLHRKMAEVLIE